MVEKKEPIASSRPPLHRWALLALPGYVIFVLAMSLGTVVHATVFRTPTDAEFSIGVITGLVIFFAASFHASWRAISARGPFGAPGESWLPGYLDPDEVVTALHQLRRTAALVALAFLGTAVAAAAIRDEPTVGIVVLSTTGLFLLCLVPSLLLPSTIRLSTEIAERQHQKTQTNLD